VLRGFGMSLPNDPGSARRANGEAETSCEPAAAAPARGVTQRDVGILAVLAIVLVATLAPLVDPFEPDTTSGDYVYYRSMAFNAFGVTRPELDRLPPGHPHSVVYRFDTWGAWYEMRNGLARQPPFAYRLLTPVLARLVEPVFGINGAFYFWTVTALMAAAFTMGLCIYRLTNAALLPAAAGVALLALDPATARLHLVRYMLTDPIALFLTVLAVYALITRRPVLFYVTCLVGVVNRESMVPMVVCYPISEYLLDRHLRWQTWAAAFAVAGAWFALRTFWPIPVDQYSVVNEFKPTLAQTKLVAETAIIVFGVLAITAWRSMWRTAGARVALSLVPFVIATFGAAWFIGSVDRILAQTIPFFVIAALGFWPEQPLARALVLVPASAYLLTQLATLVGIGGVLVTSVLSLVVVIGEVALARAMRDEVLGVE
jgi:hypothetical protein